MTRDKDVDNVVIIDPAKTTNMSSAFSAVVGMGINVLTKQICVRDVVNERFHPEELYEAAFKMCKKLGARTLGVETTGLEEFITYPLKNYMLRKGFCPEFVWLKARGGSQAESKEKRVKALVPFYREGLMYHNKRVCAPLENQLLSFPRSKYWDVMDATAYVIEMLELGERFMAPPEDLPDDDYSDLDDEDVLDNWRVA
jgi:hypothetical protein